MAYTPTTLLSLPVITTGSESGVWGDITNNGLTQYLDISIAGALSITATTTLANTAGTSTVTNIASTTAQYRTLIIPASGPSANIVITAPSSNRTFHVINRNATYTVQIRAGANSGVTLQPNQSATVGYDSVAGDYVLVGPIGPTVPVSSGGTGLTSGTSGGVPYFSSSSAIASSGALAANQFVFGGGTGSAPTSSATVSFAASFTGANTFYNSTGQTFGTGTSTQDGFIIGGRAGGSSSYRITFTPGTLSASRTVTFPDESFTVGFRNVPAVGTKTSSYQLAVGDVGKYVQIGSGGSITIPTSTFAEGDIISLFNNTSGSITITCSAPTAYIAGTDTIKTSMTLATRGVATVLFYSATACVVSGNVS